MTSLPRPERTLVTGANGFVGQHVVSELVARGGRVIAVGQQEQPEPAMADLVETYIRCDVTELDAVRALPLERVDAVINLAGLAAVGDSFTLRELYLRVNVAVLATLCEALSERDLDARVLAVSSGAVYAGDQPMPLSEDAKVDGTSSPYAESKLAMEDVAQAYRERGVDCVVVRPFNHVGPGQGPGFLVPDLFRQATQARADGVPMLVGDLSTRRDYTDVRDVAAAYAGLAVTPGLQHAVYNVCSGHSLAGTEVLDLLLDGLGARDLEVRRDPNRSRPSGQRDIVGDSTRLRRELGWEPRIPIRESLSAFLRAAVPGRPVA